MDPSNGRIYNADEIDRMRANSQKHKDIFDRLEPMEIEPTPAQLRRHPARVGRNDPCPCGSGRKFKKCCMNAETPAPTVKEMQDELTRLRTLAHLFLSKLQTVTGAAFVGVPMETLVHYPRDAAFNASRDPKTGDMRFLVQPPKTPVVLAPSTKVVTAKPTIPRRIIGI